MLVHNYCSVNKILDSVDDVVTNSLNSFDDIVNNPKALWGKSVDEVGGILGDGWTKGLYGSKGNGWKFTNGDRMVAYHPGGGRHIGQYYKIPSGAIGKIKVVGLNYVTIVGDKSVIINMLGGG